MRSVICTSNTDGQLRGKQFKHHRRIKQDKELAFVVSARMAMKDQPNAFLPLITSRYFYLVSSAIEIPWPRREEKGTPVEGIRKISLPPSGHSTSTK